MSLCSQDKVTSDSMVGIITVRAEILRREQRRGFLFNQVDCIRDSAIPIGRILMQKSAGIKLTSGFMQDVHRVTQQPNRRCATPYHVSVFGKAKGFLLVFQFSTGDFLHTCNTTRLRRCTSWL